MKKRILSAILTVFLIITLVLPLSSCSGKAPELEGIKERLVYLIEESKELNILFFGKGLPVYRQDSELSDRKMVYFNTDISGYDRVMENSAFMSIDEIKAAAEKIYTEDYSSEIFESATDGIMIGEASAYVRFYDNGEWLHQNRSMTEFKVDERIYDYSTMKIIDPSSADYINVSVESYSLSDNIRRVVYLSFAYENNDWYLDSATY